MQRALGIRLSGNRICFIIQAMQNIQQTFYNDRHRPTYDFWSHNWNLNVRMTLAFCISLALGPSFIHIQLCYSLISSVDISSLSFLNIPSFCGLWTCIHIAYNRCNLMTSLNVRVNNVLGSKTYSCMYSWNLIGKVCVSMLKTRQRVKGYDTWLSSKLNVVHKGAITFLHNELI